MSENISTEIAEIVATADVDKAMAEFTGTRQTVVSSFPVKTDADKDLLYTAMSDSEQIADHLGETFNLVGYVAQVVEFADDQTGEMREGIRMVMLDDKNRAWGGMSNGFNKALRNIIAVYGTPDTWAKPRPIKVVQEGQGTRKYFTIKLVTAK